MTRRLTKVTGEEAIAHGALAAGVGVAAGYPGSPSVGAMKALIAEARKGRLYAEWSSNETAAVEVALGASIAGQRALVCMKSVGLNVCLDPLMVANLTGVNSGLVLLFGDDPGAVSSQNEQDGRLLAPFLELPLLEPPTPHEAKDLVQAAFTFSERFHLPVLVRETSALARDRQELALEALPSTSGLGRGSGDGAPLRSCLTPYIREKMRWISLPVNVVENHRRLHEKLRAVAEGFERSPFNAVSGDGPLGVVAAGQAHQKLKAVLGDRSGLAVLKLATLHPLPERTVAEFLRPRRQVMVLEETEAFIEAQLSALAHRFGLTVAIRGKLTGDLPREGELSSRQIGAALRGLGGRSKRVKEVKRELPSRRAFCPGCLYEPTFKALAEAIEEARLPEPPVIAGDPGCMVRMMVTPHALLDLKYCMGASIGLAAGVVRANPKVRGVAVVGDSSFFHTGLANLINAAWNRVPLLILVLDNQSTALTGRQPHPGAGDTASRGPSLPLRIADFARACQVDSVQEVEAHDFGAMKAAFEDGLTASTLAVVVVHCPCPPRPEKI